MLKFAGELWGWKYENVFKKPNVLLVKQLLAAIKTTEAAIHMCFL